MTEGTELENMIITWKRYGELLATEKAGHSLIINAQKETSFSYSVMHQIPFFHDYVFQIHIFKF